MDEDRPVPDLAQHLSDLRRRLSPIAYSSASVDLDQRVHLRVSSLDDQEVLELVLEAERKGIVLEVEQVGFSLADQRQLALQLDRLRRDEPSLGIDLVALNPDGRIWVAFTGGRAPIVERIRPMAGDDRVFLPEPTEVGFFDLDRGLPVRPPLDDATPA